MYTTVFFSYLEDANYKDPRRKENLGTQRKRRFYVISDRCILKYNLATIKFSGLLIKQRLFERMSSHRVSSLAKRTQKRITAYQDRLR